MTRQLAHAPLAHGLSRLARITRKELRETLRDRRTVITLVLMPLLVYPLLNISFNKSLVATSQQITQTIYVIGVDSRQEAEVLDGLLRQGGQLLPVRAEELGSATAGEPAIPGELIEIRWFDDSDLPSRVADFDVDAAVRIRPAAPPADEGSGFHPVVCELIYRSNSPISRQAMQAVEDRLNAVNAAVLQGRLAQAGLSVELPAEPVRRPMSAGGPAPFSLATLVPLVLILMTITGAVYPAIDLTAGERERGTLETLIAAPVSRMTLLVAKYVAVLTVAVLTAMVNLVAMTVTILTSSLGGHLFPDGLSIPLMIEIFGLMVLFAAFFSSILLTLTSFARSFKEAQAYLIPIMLLAISPGLLSLMPGVRLTGVLAVTPLVNIVLLARDMLEGNASSMMAAVAVLSTLIYAAAALVLASKVFGNDALLYASRGSWSELFLRPTQARERPTAAATVTCLAVMFPCFFLLSNLAQRYAQDNMSTVLLLNGAVTIMVFGVCPWLFAVAQRVRMQSGFHLSGPSPLALLGAACLGLSIWPFAHELFLFGKWTGLVTLEQDRLFELERWFNAFQGLAPAMVFLTLAVVPAVLEEWFFRGFLLSGLRDRFTGRQAVVTSSLLFGLFHVLTPSMLTPERFLPSTFLGLVLGWVCYRTGSVFPGMLLHACHNGLLLWMVRNRPTLIDWGWNLQVQERIPTGWLAAAVITALCGALLVLLAGSARRRKPRVQPAEPN